MINPRINWGIFSYSSVVTNGKYRIKKRKEIESTVQIVFTIFSSASILFLTILDTSSWGGTKIKILKECYAEKETLAGNTSRAHRMWKWTTNIQFCVKR